jgi:hypothetical protein
MTWLAGSASATQPPRDVLAYKAFHQFGLVGLQKPAQRFLENPIAAGKPTLFHQGVDLTVQSFGDFRLNG